MPDVNKPILWDDPVTPVATDEMPEQRAVRIPTPQPGRDIVLQLPESITAEMWSRIDLDNGAKRVSLNFRNGAELKSYPGGVAYRTSINNMEREVTVDRASGKKATVTDLGYLALALRETGTFKTNADYRNAIARHGGDYFMADWEWSARCNERRDIWKDGAQVKDHSGCGRRYAERARTYPGRDGKVTVHAIPRSEDGSYKDVFDCACGANLFVNGNLRNFRPVELEGAAADVPF